MTEVLSRSAQWLRTRIALAWAEARALEEAQVEKPDTRFLECMRELKNDHAWRAAHCNNQTGYANAKLSIPVWDNEKNKPGIIVAFLNGIGHVGRAVVLYEDGEIASRVLNELKWKGVT